MKAVFLKLFFLFQLPLFCNAQQIFFSEPSREDLRDVNFEVLGKINKNILIFHDVRWKYALHIFNDSMELKEKLDLDFLPKKTFNVDFVVYPDFFYLIYQYQKKGALYCMAAKMGGDGKIINEPQQLDSTQVGIAGDYKIYSTIYSEDKQKIMLFKIQKTYNQLNFVTLLYNNNLQLIHKTRQHIEYNERRDVYSDFALDNEGNLVFAGSLKEGSGASPTKLYLVIKKADQDSFINQQLNLKEVYLDEVKLKVDNVNKKYIVNTFFNKVRRGNIDGIFCSIWDVKADSIHASVFAEFDDSIRNIAKSSGNAKLAFNDFFIRDIFLKKDGSFILTAEDFSSQTSGFNNWNRYDYLYNPGYINSYDYYLYSNPYGSFYRPFSSFGNTQMKRYFYDNVLILDVSASGVPQWTEVIHKQQYGDDNDNYLSYGTYITGGSIHFLYNDISKRTKLLSENVIFPDGKSKRNPTLKNYEKEYEFMPRFCKQIAARQIIIPCTYRNQISFAKIDF